MKKLFLILLSFIFCLNINVMAKEFNFYVDTTCGADEEDCYKTLDEAFSAVADDKSSFGDDISFIVIDSNVEISHSYVVNGHLKFVIDDVENDNKFEFNGNNNTITTGNYVEFTGNSELSISNLNIKDTYASANYDSNTLKIENDVVSLNCVSVVSLKYTGLLAGSSDYSEYDLDSVQVSGAEVGIDFFGKNLSIIDSTFDDNTIGFNIEDAEASISNSKINSIYSKHGAKVTVSSNNTLPKKPLYFIKLATKGPASDFDTIDPDDYFIIAFDSDSSIKMALEQTSEVVLTEKNSKVDIFKLFNGIENYNVEDIEWTTSDQNVASIKDGFVILLREGEATVKGDIPNTDVSLSVKFVVSNPPDNSIGGKIKNVVTNPKTYSTLFVFWLMVFVITCTLLVYRKRKLEVTEENVI